MKVAGVGKEAGASPVQEVEKQVPDEDIKIGARNIY
jgi:hypothetical protein